MHAGMAAIGLALEFAKIKLGLEEFKKHQTTAIRNFVEGHDLLVNLQTGFGKVSFFKQLQSNCTKELSTIHIGKTGEQSRS